MPNRKIYFDPADVYPRKLASPADKTEEDSIADVGIYEDSVEINSSAYDRSGLNLGHGVVGISTQDSSEEGVATTGIDDSAFLGYGQSTLRSIEDQPLDEPNLAPRKEARQIQASINRFPGIFEGDVENVSGDIVFADEYFWGEFNYPLTDTNTLTTDLDVGTKIWQLAVEAADIAATNQLRVVNHAAGGALQTKTITTTELTGLLTVGDATNGTVAVDNYSYGDATWTVAPGPFVMGDQFTDAFTSTEAVYPISWTSKSYLLFVIGRTSYTAPYDSQSIIWQNNASVGFGIYLNDQPENGNLIFFGQAGWFYPFRNVGVVGVTNSYPTPTFKIPNDTPEGTPFYKAFYFDGTNKRTYYVHSLLDNGSPFWIEDLSELTHPANSPPYTPPSSQYFDESKDIILQGEYYSAGLYEFDTHQANWLAGVKWMYDACLTGNKSTYPGWMP